MQLLYSGGGKMARAKQEFADVEAADRALIEAASGGERAAQDVLAARLMPVVQARVARRLWPMRRADVRRDVEDYTQDVMQALFEGKAALLQRWEAERGLSLDNFAGLLAERMVISKLRSGRHNPWREQMAEPADIEAAAASESAHECGGEPPRELAAADLLRGLLARLQGAVSPQGFKLFELIFLADTAVPEVVASTGLSADAVYAWRSRLRRVAKSLYPELTLS